MSDYLPPRGYIPASFTLGNLVCGFYSVIFAAIYNDFKIAALLIVVAAIMDFLDGMVARLTNSTSKFGVELDSIADVVSFGLAPAVLLFTIGYKDTNSTLPIALKWIAPAIYLSGGALRLARFNAELVGFDKEFFYGLPIPSAAFAVSLFALSFTSGKTFSMPFIAADLLLAVSMGLLMFSRVKFNPIPKPSISGIKENPFFFLFALVSLIGLFSFGFIAVFLLFIGFVTFFTVKHLFSSTKRVHNH